MLANRWLLRSFTCLSLLAIGCGGDDESEKKNTAPSIDPPGDGPAGGVHLLAGDCDSLTPTQCGFPFPSNVYLVDDTTGLATSGKQVMFGAATLPKNLGLYPVDPTILSYKDGFSTGSGPQTHMPGATFEGVARPTSIERSLEDTSPSILIEADTGRRVPHWVDIDQSTPNDGLEDRDDERAIQIRPAERLKDATRYIVAFRNIQHRDGHVIEPVQAFRELRDELKTEDYGVKRRRALYADIFGKLETAGYPRADLQVAWDFTTATKENTTRRMVALRDRALEAVGAAGPSFVVTEVEESPGNGILRRIHVKMTVPMFLNFYAKGYKESEWETQGGYNRLMLDEQGLPEQNGTMEQDVLIIVPEGVTSGTKHGLLQNGHGLFGSRFEGQGGYLARMAADYGWIAFSTNLFGFAEDDVGLAITALGARPLLFNSFFDRQQQGQVNQLLAMRMMMGRIATDGIKDPNDPSAYLLDPSWIDPSVRAYRGDSQGGIMGTTYCAVSTDVTRCLVGEPGMPYSLLLNRSKDWPAYDVVLRASYNTGLNNQFMVALIQQGWDASEPVGYAPYMTTDLLPNTPPHYLLIHPAIGDHQVVTWAAHIIARSVGAVNLASPAGEVHRTVPFLEQATAPVTNRSAMVEWEFGLAPEPLENLPPKDGCDPHDRVRVLDPAYEQQDHFFRTGEIKWTCDGLCNCDSANEEAGCERTRDAGDTVCKP
ncbi:MAG: hypothetical protein IT376_21160 [Polyangiaceae bacterium]|nr:hypothetical protein [Polyangiaceae bacterium]